MIIVRLEMHPIRWLPISCLVVLAVGVIFGLAGDDGTNQQKQLDDFGPTAYIKNLEQPNDVEEPVEEEEDDLRQLFIFHRHGDRAPLDFLPDDPYKEKANDIWELGLGLLTNEGKDRMFKLGKYLRRRYSNFLTNNFREVYTVSSDVDRTIESAQLVMAGLYSEPDEKLIWNKDLRWVPVTVHTVPRYYDHLLGAMCYCPRRKRDLMRFSLNSNELKTNINRCPESQRIINNLIKDYGFDPNSGFNYLKAYSALKIEYEKGLKLPDWLMEQPESTFKIMDCMANEAQYLLTYTDYLKRATVGPLLRDIVDKMMNRRLVDSLSNNKFIDLTYKLLHKIQERRWDKESDFEAMVQKPTVVNPDSIKVYHYSAHDVTLHAILDTLGVQRSQVIEWPDFGATILIELRQNRRSKLYYVRLLYLGKTLEEDNNLKELKLDLCLNQNGLDYDTCPLYQFDRVTRKYQVNYRDWKKECQIDHGRSN